MMEACDTGSGDSAIDFRQSFDNLIIGPSARANDLLSNSLYPVIRFCLVIIARVGFLLVQVGSVPITNVNLILLQNILDFCWSSFVSLMLSPLIALTGDFGGVVGGGYWIGHELADKQEVLIGWQTSVFTSAICTTCISGRMHTLGSLIVVIVMTGILQPLTVHWAGTIHGWMMKHVLFDYTVHFRDLGGPATIHIMGGLTGLIGCISLGRRLLRLRDIDNSSLSIGSAATAFTGHLFIVVGLQTLWIQHSFLEANELWRKRIPLVPVNYILSMSLCAMVVVAFHFMRRDPFNHWTVMRCVQAVTAGGILVAAGADVYTPVASVVLGCAGGALFYLSSKLMFRTALEDYCNTVTLHIIIPLVGSFVAGFFYDPKYELSVGWIMTSITWKILCLIIIMALIICVMAPLFCILNWLGLLRNRSEFLNHMRSSAAVQRAKPRSCLKRLFDINDDSILVQPGLPGQEYEIRSGPLSSKYQRTITRIEIEEAANDENESA